VVGDLETAGRATIGFLGDPNNQKVFLDLAGIAGGLGLIVAGAGGEVGEAAFDVTGIGALVGVPINIASAGVIVAGAGGVAYGGTHLGSDITHMSAGDGGTPPDSGPGQWGSATGKGGSERAWQYQESKTGRPRTDGYHVDNPATGKSVEFDDYQDGNLIDYKGPGYEKPLTGDTSRPPGNGFVRSILDSATRQAKAAPPGTPIVWHVAERGAAAQMQKLLNLDPATDRIVVVWDP